jgi:hypothetical protein
MTQTWLIFRASVQRHPFRWAGFTLLAGLAAGFWLWVPRPPILPDPGGCLRREEGRLVFDGRQKPDVLSEGAALLVLERAQVWDNGEEWWPIHGPYGSLSIDIYQPLQPPGPPWHDEYLLHTTRLHGPHLNFPGLYEWLDSETVYYEHYGLYDWTGQADDQVVLRLYERDPGPGREHDDLLAIVVDRAATEAEAVTFRSPAMAIQVHTPGLGE